MLIVMTRNLRTIVFYIIMITILRNTLLFLGNNYVYNAFHKRFSSVEVCKFTKLS